MKIHLNQNFIRIFQLPQEYPRDFCFNGGHPVVMHLIDWFYPLPQEDFWSCKEKEYSEEQLKTIREQITKFIRQKTYCLKGYKYLALTNYNDSFIIEKDSNQ